MTNKQKATIDRLVQQGESITAIAETMGLSKSAVKSYLYRSTEKEGRAFCAQCGKAMDTYKRPTRRFCSDACRTRWWNHHQQKTLAFTGICAYCHHEFRMRRNGEKKYCSHACYIADRFQSGEHRD